MGTVVMHNVVSVDGFIADEKDDVGPLHEWYFSGDPPITAGDGERFDHSGVGTRFRVSSASSAYVRSMWNSIATFVMGRRLFDLVNGWEGHPPAGEHVVVVSHRPKPEGWHPEASYHFVDDVAAGRRYFGNIDRQYLLADLDVVIRGDRVLHLRFKVRR